MQEIHLDAKVVCTDGECGRLSHVIIDENSKKVTHLAVKNSNPLASHQYLVPIESVTEGTPESIQLSCKRIEVFRMPAFTEMRFFNPITSKYESLKDFSDEAISAFNNRMMCFDSSTGEDKCSMRVEAELIPAGEIAVSKGALVEATDGYIGRVKDFAIDSNNRNNTCLIFEEGHLWHKKELTLPLSAIAHINEDRIYLNLDKKAVRREAMP
ncbi:MAG: hypothetical protein Tsb0014_32540 [Pleurocapsa sp.]